jgi:hypothetical protein
MSFALILILTAYSSGLVGGQLLFKIAAVKAAPSLGRRNFTVENNDYRK